ncbi:MFS transporter [Bradyrhizobium sp. 14AA]
MNKTVAAGISEAKPLYSNGYKATVLALLLGAYTFNFIDRQIISIIGQAIKVDLKLSDTQLGLLGGLYFALLYTVLGLPIARWAERGNRVTIITLALITWSGFTALCGAAHTFVQLAIFRFGVGIGEAGCNPPAHSLISDYFEPKKRATALSIYSFGIPLGVMIGAAAGGWLATEFSWRVAFVVVGAPGIILAFLFKVLVKEPPRGHSEPTREVGADLSRAQEEASFSVIQEFRELGAVAKVLFGKWPVLHMVLGITLASAASYSSNVFSPAYFVRMFGLDLTTIGLVVGLIGGFSAGLGMLAGGFISDWAGRKSVLWYTLIPAIGLAIAGPLQISAYMVDSWKAAALFFLFAGIFQLTYLAPTFAIVQNSVPPHRRATASAVLSLFLNLVALGGGPVFAGLLIDHLAQFNFNNPGLGFAGMFSAFGGDAASSFGLACPGGVAPANSSIELASRCRGAIALATRQGIVVTQLLYAWASMHYFLAAIGLVKHMKDAQAD